MINQRTKIKEKYKLKKTPEKGEGIFATEEIQENELVMLGVIEKSVDQNLMTRYTMLVVKILT